MLAVLPTATHAATDGHEIALSWSSNWPDDGVDSRDSDQDPADSTSMKGPLSSPTATQSDADAHDTARMVVG
jgi:hypothetical protein